MEYLLRIFVNWGMIGGISVLVTGLIGKLISTKTQCVSCAGVMSILNGVLALCIGTPAALEIKGAQCHCEFCIGHAETMLFLVSAPICIVSVVCLIIAIRQRKRKTTEG